MLKKHLDIIIGQVDELVDLIRSYQSTLTDVGAKKVQNILNNSYIDIEKIVKEKWEK